MAKKSRSNSEETKRKIGRLFAKQLIARMNEISASDWQQGWVDGPKGVVPQNIQGRPYTGGNPFFLLLDTAKHGYAAPIYATDKMIFKLNDRLRGKDDRIPEDKLDQIIKVKKGEHYVPVLFWLVNIKDKDGNKITLEDYDKLSSEDQNACKKYFDARFYPVFNIDQTNMAEVDKDRYQAIIDKATGGKLNFTNSNGMYSNAVLDRMFDKQEWLCPIHVDVPRSDCFYRPSVDAIYGPMKGQFKMHDEKEPEELYKDGMEFYSSIVHEMAHSTGSPKRLDREGGKRFGDAKYAKEELVAEITAAMTGSILGFDKRIKDNNIAYVKNWLETLKEKPEFILDVMTDVEKASDMILAEVEKQEKKIDAEQGQSEALAVKTDERPAQVEVQTLQPEEHVVVEAKSLPVSEPDSVDDDKPKLYDVYGMKDGKQELVKTGLTMEASAKFVERNDQRYQRKGYDYLISMPQEERGINKSLPEQNATEKVSDEADRTLKDIQENGGKAEGMYYFDALHEEYVKLGKLSYDEGIFPHYGYNTVYGRVNAWVTMRDFHEGKLKTKEQVQKLQATDAAVKEPSSRKVPTIQEYFADNKLENGQTVDKLTVYQQDGKSNFYTEVGEMKMSREASKEDLKAFFDRTTPVSDIVAKNFGEMLHLASFYNQFKLAEGVADVRLKKDTDGNWFVEAKLADGRDTSSHVLSWHDKQALFTQKTATKEQLAARYLNPEIKKMMAEKNVEEQHTQQHEIQDAMETKKEQEAKQKAAEAQKEAQRQKEQSEKQKQAQEQAKQQQQQQKEQEEKKESHKSVSSAVVQSTLLITALEFAKAHGGLFLNPSGKAAPQIINSKTSLTPYNQVMLALKSDQEGWRTNAYTFMKPAADAGMPVRKGEKSTPANWVQWSYKNTQTGEVIDSKKFKDIPESDRDLYERTHERKSYPLFNVDQTVMNAKKHDEYINLLNTVGQRFETIKDFEHNDLAKRTTELMAKLPHTVVLYKNGENIEAYGGSAKKLQKFLSDTKGFKTSEVTNEAGKKTLVATFPENRLNANLKTINKNGERITFLENKDMATFIKNPLDTKAVVLDALQDLDKVTRTTGVKMERVMRDVPVEYDASKDTITYSGVGKDDGTLRSVSASVEKANDLYRSLVSATNSEPRLDLQHRVNMTPEDAAAHVALVRDMAAGVLMTRHGLPSSLSVDTMNSIDHLINELKENPNKVNLLERGVNTTLEVIDKAKIGRTVDYAKIRGEKLALSDSNAMNYSIIRNLQSMPDKDTKEIVVIKDKAAGKADVILPQGASLEANNEAPGMSKVRITKALSKEGISDVTFYNARGGLGLNQPNAYFQGKDITLSKLKQYELQTKKELDVSSAIAKSQDVKIEKFRSIKDDNGKYVFFIKPEGEKSFSVQPSKDDVTKYYDAVRTKDKQIMNTVHGDLEQKYYRIATNHPEYKREVIMPDTSKVDSGKVKIENATITRDKGDNQVYIQAHVDGKFMRQPATPQQWDRMWLADDMQEYKNAVAAVTFAPKIEEKQSESQSQSTAQSQTASVGTTQEEEVKDSQSEDKSDKNALDEGGKSAADDGKTDVPEQSEDKEESEEEEEEVRHGRGL